MTRHLALLLGFAVALGLGSGPADAQEPTFALAPARTPVDVHRDVPFARSDTTTLRMDVYRPADPAAHGAPLLIYFNRATGARRADAFPAGWGRAAASRGVVTVIPDLRDGTQAGDFQLLLAHLAEHASALGADPNAIAVFAPSGNVVTAFPLVEDPKQTAVKAAVMYYGDAPVADFRLDLPVLYVRAGLDRPPVNAGITALATRAIAQNAPLTLLNHPGGYHGFEMFNDDDATRDVVDQTIAFVRRATAPAYQAAIRRALPEARAAGYVQTGEFGKAAAVYREMVAARPDDARLRLAYGEALLGDAQYATACAEFEKLKGKGLGARDLGLPAARACLQKGDADAAIAWLRSIPSRFLPPQVQDEPVFAPLKERAEFRALFSR